MLPTYIRDSIFQNCVFQISATLEDYVAELISQWFAQLGGHGAPNSAIPLHTRSFFVAKSQEDIFKSFLALGDEGELVRE